ncbi:alkaline phosphatase [Candidatus Epulonipiscium fishelsonii]|uniref:Alkaline phosphatase n=1 Tax=Candidatus Epulonipiscium fishelsonii TaxID=77094 RepID=A0ACC8XAX6_9FIRM|nr:alkaline phosphatase [Epulopiscium sp. SCG-B11WGA-EpuloA1]
MKLTKKSGIAIISASVLASILAFTGTEQPIVAEETAIVEEVKADKEVVQTEEEEASVEKEELQAEKDVAPTIEETPKYIFAFIGDGMSHVQINSAQVYNGTRDHKDEVALTELNFTKFPTLGNMYTQDATSFDPDSASTATSMLTGEKTHSGVIGLGIDKTTVLKTLPEMLKEDGYKIGVVSTVTLNHATPAASYAHTESRDNYYDIAMQMADSNFDYFAGGELSEADDDGTQKSAYEVMEEKGYTVVNTAEEFENIKNGDKVYAISPDADGAMPYSLDAAEDALTLADFVEKGIEVLDNEDKGFFMWIESGKIDWAGHANDAMANIQDTLALDKAVEEAIEFYNEHPEDTLIIVTGDHETGGMTIGQASTGYDTAFDLLDNQKVSYDKFDDMFADFKANNPEATFTDVLDLIKDNFGLVTEDDTACVDNEALILSDYEYDKLFNAFEESMKPRVADTEENDILYGGYEPITVTLTHILNAKAGIGWTSYSHTGVPVAIYAMGENASTFSGAFDNTELFDKLVSLYAAE